MSRRARRALPAAAWLLGAAALLGACRVAQLAEPPGTAPARDWRRGEIVVTWTEAPASEQVRLHAERLGGQVLAVEGQRALLRVPAGQELRACVELRAADPSVRHAEPNRVVRSQHVGTLRPLARRLQALPNDEAFGRGSPVPGQAVTWGLSAIRAEAAWEVSTGDPGILVAVIDTGVDMAHPDLATNLDRSGARNFVEAGRPPDDDFGHGTHVAGIIAAVGNNSQGAAGVAFRTKVLPLRVLGVDGSGSTWNTVAALDYAVARKASVINLSLGSSERSDVEEEAIQRAIQAGAVVVAAAGNEATDGNYLEYPASYPGVVSVAAIGPDLKRAPFSNFNSWVTLSAPGVDVFSTIPTQFSPGVPYGYMSGTSMAAPMVAGAAALLFAVYPRWTPAQVVERLRRSARELTPQGDPVAGFDVFFGAGLLDVGKALGK
ncbi:MAG: S8 family serine peptidase [Candidatus Sericytochromatia bacterium]|nr:S8 family serine peptidase [Candidatus Sericytochromatia bacterium]